MKKVSIFIIAIAFMFVGTAMAADDSLRSSGMHKASDIMGKKVVSQQGEDLGSVDDIIIGEQGQVQYILLSRGGILGMGGDNVPVPWEAANLKMQEDEWVSSLDKQTLDNAPTFEGDQQAQFSDPAYEQELRSYYGTQGTQGMQRDLESPGTTRGADPQTEKFGQDRDLESPGTTKGADPQTQDQDTERVR